MTERPQTHDGPRSAVAPEAAVLTMRADQPPSVVAVDLIAVAKWLTSV